MSRSLEGSVLHGVQFTSVVHGFPSSQKHAGSSPLHSVSSAGVEGSVKLGPSAPAFAGALAQPLGATNKRLTRARRARGAPAVVTFMTQNMGSSTRGVRLQNAKFLSVEATRLEATPFIAASHAQQLVELVARWGVTQEALFQGTGIDPASFADPKARAPVPLVATIAARAKALTGEPGLGFYLGLSMRASSHGYLGFAAMASATLGDALDVAVRFTPTRTDAMALHKHVSNGVVSVVVEELAPMGEATDVLVLSMLIGLQVVGEALAGCRMSGSADVALPEPPNMDRFQNVVRGGIRFGQPVHQLVFDASALDLPLVMADKAAHALAREQCERELAELGYDGQASRRLRALMEQKDAGFPSLDEAAKVLGFSPRTLKRRLDDEGTSFSAIVDELRRQRALILLRSPAMSVDDVADRVGYSDIANFTRAFRRWTGMTPTAYRRAR